MKKQTSIDKISERLFLLSEYKYYNEINEAPEDEEVMDDEDQLEDGDDLEDSDDLEDGDDLESEEQEFEEPVEEEVEIDVSGMVDSIDQNAEGLDKINMKIDSMGTQFGNYIDKLMKNNKELAKQVTQMSQNIELEFQKRIPTPNEALMLRSLSSYPYNKHVSDYWQPAKKEEYGHSISNPNLPNESEENRKPKEYVLTDKSINDDYNEIDIRNSL